MREDPLNVKHPHDVGQLPKRRSQIPGREISLQTEAVNVYAFRLDLRDFGAVAARDAHYMPSCPVFAQKWQQKGSHRDG
jgi:hypothetical protein